MLDPNQRSIYTAALTPPPGFVFDTAIATTFSLDPVTLLTIPVQLALGRSLLTPDKKDQGMILLESLRRVTERLSVYCQRGLIQVPTDTHSLLGLLETMVIEVLAPRGGVFHPKLWLLRFIEPESENPPLLRLCILSRNLTQDRSWDLSLQLEGRPDKRERAVNRELADFIAYLPKLAKHPVPAERREQASSLAEEVRRTNLELPPGFDSLRFHILGRQPRSWKLPKGHRLVVISPFADDRGLEKLIERADTAEALISRVETLGQLRPDTRTRFKQCLVLQEAAETEDGEDQAEGGARDTYGLHAKAYIFENGRKITLIMGSANATEAALVRSKNVEILVELKGRRGKELKGIGELLSLNGFGGLLEPYQEEEASPSYFGVQQATEALEKARKIFCAADLRVVYEPTSDRSSWEGHLIAQGLAKPSGVAIVQAWPITVSRNLAKDIAAIFNTGRASIARIIHEGDVGATFEAVLKV